MKPQTTVDSYRKRLLRRYVPKLQSLLSSAAGDSDRAKLSQTLSSDLSKPLNAEDLVAKLTDDCDFRLVFRQGEKSRIPLQGPLVVTINHPLAATDLLLVYRLLSSIRPDTRIFHHRIIKSFEGLKDIQVFPGAQSSKYLVADSANPAIRSPSEHLAQGGVVLVVPAKSLNRFGVSGLRDSRWSARFLKLASANNVPIQPMHLDTGSLFTLYRQNIGKRWLPKSLVGNASSSTHEHDVLVRVGCPIESSCYSGRGLSNRAAAKLFRSEVYRLAKDKPSLFERPSGACSQVSAADQLKTEIMRCERLDSISGMQVLLYRCSTCGVLLDEIGRLRELTFKAIGEGTGKETDTDEFDLEYDHIILWDDIAERIAGAYRLRPANRIGAGEDNTSYFEYSDKPALYTQTLFNYKPSSEEILDVGLELGRSFVHPDYWGSRSLDYLWLGIAAYLRKYPYYRYLFGAVSISNALSSEAKDALVVYYDHFYGSSSKIVSCKTPYYPNRSRAEIFSRVLKELDLRSGFVELKRHLAEMGCNVPMLYKQYTGLCEPGGVTFHGFNIDADFSDCVDGFVLVDIYKLLPLKRKRYNLEGYPERFSDQRQHA